MTDLRSRASELYTLEQLSSGNTVIHRLHPLVKLLSTLVYLLCVASCGRYALTQLFPFLFYPVLLTALAELPYRLLWKRTFIALPFCLFAGISNLVLDRGVLYYLGPVPVSFGAVSLGAILLRTLLCVWAVLALVAVTPFLQLTAQLRRMHVPHVFLSLFEMTYRYLGALLEEAGSMYTAYRLRSQNPKGLELRHMGSFVGQLLLKSFDRAERVYHAMKCRGYALRDPALGRAPLSGGDVAFFLITCGSSLLFRTLDLPLLLGRLF